MFGLPDEFTPGFLSRLEELRIRTHRQYAGMGREPLRPPKRGSSLESNDYRFVPAKELVLGRAHIPIDPQGRMLVDYGNLDKFTGYRFSDVLNKKVPPDAFEGKIVLIGLVLREKLWAYPWLIAVLVAFIAYQIYQITVQFSAGLTALTVFDAILVWLTWREYRTRRALRSEPVAAVRRMGGATRRLEAGPGSIRGDYALEVGENIIHASDAPETAEQETALWFGS